MARIVVGIDGSEDSRDALRWAGQEAELRDATLQIVHTWPRPYRVSGPTTQLGPSFDVPPEEAERHAAEKLVEDELDATGVDATGVRIETELREGDPADTLLAAAREADLLVIGSSRHGGLPLRLGEVARRCIEHAPCPVMVVRTGQSPSS